MSTPTCRRCGATADGDEGIAPLGWSTSAEGDRVELLCDRCTRDHVRDIEGKLDEAWWT